MSSTRRPRLRVMVLVRNFSDSLFHLAPQESSPLGTLVNMLGFLITYLARVWSNENRRSHYFIIMEDGQDFALTSPGESFINWQLVTEMLIMMTQ
ncbi:hypothetical protein RRG08_054326 [Elysia crispata]|uniref:Uncharacterized protein n=1 Tax=Elysia crispata TaxID=231223 RepID=A0AAE1B5W2_9GAST|nr:hypothetical protein RRG08_054326 [Elysia crispata]